MNVYKQHQIGHRGDQEATKSRCHTSRINEDRIPTRIEKPIRDTTITRRHRHHERDLHRHDPTKRAKSN